jgi:hypothetical protein
VFSGEALSRAEELGAGEVERRLLPLECMGGAQEGEPGPVADHHGGLFQLFAREPASTENFHEVAAEESAQCWDEGVPLLGLSDRLE